MSYFNVRAYGILINDNQEVLLSDECHSRRNITKFPGGGLELGEGLIDAVKREFMEECNMEIEVISHFYTTDFYEKSSFNDSQIVSIYYLVKATHTLTLLTKLKHFDFEHGNNQSFRWKTLGTLTSADVTFRTDKTAVDLLKKHFND